MARIFYDWTVVQAYHDEGHGVVECVKHFGFTKSGLNKAVRRGALSIKPETNIDGRRRHDWAEIRAYYDAGFSYRECQAKFRFSNAAWTKAKRRGEITSRRFGMSIGELLSSPQRDRKHVKTRLVREGLLKNSCQSCGLASWHGKPLNMHLDHINGVKNDNRLENLRMLCPNCHSQTPTYGGRNLKRATVARTEPSAVVLSVSTFPG
jgi:5-methylcytosine-specific restriction endonuclease McrA